MIIYLVFDSENTGKQPPVPPSSKDTSTPALGSRSMRVLWLNWRDIRNPEAGGAEVLTHEVMRRLVKKGYQMTLFSAHFSNAQKEEKIDGIKIITSPGDEI
jgi:hypothetical protein